METRLLQSFLTVAQTGSLSGAAQTLHISQPALSRQIAALEKDLGQRLFSRGGRKLQLTGEGARFRKRAEEILELVDKTWRAFANPGQDINGDVYVGSGETRVLGFAAEIMREIRAFNPNIRFHIFSGDGDEVSERLNSGLLDFGLFIEPAQVSMYESIRLPETDTWGALMLKSHPLAKKPGVAPEDLWREPLIISKQNFMERHISKWMRRGFSELNIAATYNLLYNASILARKGLGIALGLDRLINLENDSELCFRPCQPELKVAVYFAWKKHNSFTPAVSLFLNKMIEKLS